MTSVDKLGDPMLPDLANPPKIRTRRAPKHDFKDGKGRVFAHRHDNGGGWVADTAWVAPTATVTRNAQVYDFARVHDSCRVSGHGRVYGHARLFNSARVDQHAHVCDYAMLFNEVTLNGFVSVNNNAKVFGSSRLCRNTNITNHAIVINTDIVGPTHNAWAHICGNARLLNCRCSGYLSVGGATVAENSTLHNMRADLGARIYTSSVQTLLPYEYYALFDGSNITPPRPLEQATVCVLGTVVSCDINTPGWQLSSGARFIGTRIYSNEFGEATRVALQSISNQAVVDLVMRNSDEIHNMVQRVLNPHATAGAALGLAPAVRAEANLDAVRQRRIMRMERT